MVHKTEHYKGILDDDLVCCKYVFFNVKFVRSLDALNNHSSLNEAKLEDFLPQRHIYPTQTVIGMR